MEKFIYTFSARTFGQLVEKKKQAGLITEENDIKVKTYGFYDYNIVDGTYHWRKTK